MRVLHDAVGLTALVVLGQVLGDGQSFVGDEEQTVTVFELLHLVAGADPPAKLGLRRGVGIEVAGTEGSADLVDMGGQAVHHGFGDAAIGMQ
jgi:hypothetical protein